MLPRPTSPGHRSRDRLRPHHAEDRERSVAFCTSLVALVRSGADHPDRDPRPRSPTPSSGATSSTRPSPGSTRPPAGSSSASVMLALPEVQRRGDHIGIDVLHPAASGDARPLARLLILGVLTVLLCKPDHPHRGATEMVQFSRMVGVALEPDPGSAYLGSAGCSCRSGFGCCWPSSPLVSALLRAYRPGITRDMAMKTTPHARPEMTFLVVLVAPHRLPVSSACRCSQAWLLFSSAIVLVRQRQPGHRSASSCSGT
jgi:hypothetical protein